MNDLIIRAIDYHDNPYLQLVSEAGTIFNEPGWLDLFGQQLKTYGIFDQGQSLVGAFTLWQERVCGIKYVKSPLTAPHNALIIRNTTDNIGKRYTFEKAIHTAIADFLKKQRAGIIQFGLPPDIKDVQPYLWKNFKVSPTYTYQINLDEDADVITGRFDQKVKSDISKAQKDGVVAVKTDNMDEVSQIMRKMGDRKPETGGRMVNKIISEFSGGGRSFAFVSRKEGKVIATVYCVHDDRTAYYILGGYDSDIRQRGAVGFALQEAILYSREIGLHIFDFEGSMIPSIEFFFRGFGGQLTPKFTVHRACLVLEMGLKFVKRSIY